MGLRCVNEFLLPLTYILSWDDRVGGNSPTNQTTGTLGTSEKKPVTADNFASKGQENGNSQRTKQHICKSHKPTHDQNLQKSCFLADAPHDTETIDVSCKQFDFLIR